MNWRTVITRIDEEGTVLEESELHKYVLCKKVKEKTIQNKYNGTVYWTYIYKLSNQLNLFT